MVLKELIEQRMKKKSQIQSLKSELNDIEENILALLKEDIDTQYKHKESGYGSVKVIRNGYVIEAKKSKTVRYNQAGMRAAWAGSNLATAKKYIRAKLDVTETQYKKLVQAAPHDQDALVLLELIDEARDVEINQPKVGTIKLAEE